MVTFDIVRPDSIDEICRLPKLPRSYERYVFNDENGTSVNNATHASLTAAVIQHKPWVHKEVYLEPT